MNHLPTIDFQWRLWLVAVRLIFFTGKFHSSNEDGATNDDFPVDLRKKNTGGVVVPPPKYQAFQGGGSFPKMFVKLFCLDLERQVFQFLKATLPVKLATIALKIGHLAFQGVVFWVEMVNSILQFAALRQFV